MPRGEKRTVDSEHPQFTKAVLDRRQYRRVKLVAQVHCEALKRDEVMVTRDVSVGGMFINVYIPIPIDSEVSVKFRLHPAEEPISCRATVMFSRVGLGMGIQFQDLGAESQRLLQQFVDEAA